MVRQHGRGSRQDNADSTGAVRGCRLRLAQKLSPDSSGSIATSRAASQHRSAGVRRRPSSSKMRTSFRLRPSSARTCSRAALALSGRLTTSVPPNPEVTVNFMARSRQPVMLHIANKKGVPPEPPRGRPRLGSKRRAPGGVGAEMALDCDRGGWRVNPANCGANRLTQNPPRGAKKHAPAAHELEIRKCVASHVQGTSALVPFLFVRFSSAGGLTRALDRLCLEPHLVIILLHLQHYFLLRRTVAGPRHTDGLRKFDIDSRHMSLKKRGHFVENLG